MVITANSLQERAKNGGLCKMLAVRLIKNPAIVSIAIESGFDALWIELEHSGISIDDANNLCMTALLAGITPFVRVPYQCGFGFVQRILDGGAMGVIFPHIHSKVDAEAAVRISKYPPLGCRSMTGQLPLFGLRAQPIPTVVEETNQKGSSVILMIETKDSIDNIDEIAAVPGVEALLIGSNDLSIELGAPGDFKSPQYRSAVEAASQACKKHGKVLAFAGIYDNPELQGWAVRDMGASLILGHQDSGLLASSGKKCAEALDALVR